MTANHRVEDPTNRRSWDGKSETCRASEWQSPEPMRVIDASDVLSADWSTPEACVPQRKKDSQLVRSGSYFWQCFPSPLLLSLLKHRRDRDRYHSTVYGALN